jgi:hypothetical protein
MNNDDDPLRQRAEQVQAHLVERHGQEAVTAMIGHIGQVGVDQGALRRLVASPDAVNEMEALGMEATLRVMQGSPRDPATRNAEEVYSSIRRRQKEEWRMGKGRR